MRITVVRHGQTKENRKSVCQKQIEGSLSRQGKAQARLLAKALSKDKFDIIFSSDSQRTLETAKEIMKYQKASLKTNSLLREKNLGEFIGHSRATYYAAVAGSRLGKMNYRPVGGESYSDILKRAKKFTSMVLKSKYQNILIVTHGGMVKMFAVSILKCPVSKFINMSPHNAGISIFQSNSKTFTAKKIDSITHLK